MLRRVNQIRLKLRKCRLDFAFSFVLSIKTGCLVSLCSRYVAAGGLVFHCFGAGFPLLPGKPGNAGGPRFWGWLGLFQVHFNLGWPLCAHTKEPASPFSDHCGLCVGGLPGRWRQALRPMQASLYACKLVCLQRQPPSRVAQYVVDAGLGDAAVALVGGPAPHVAGLQIVIVGLYPEVGHGRAPVE